MMWILLILALAAMSTLTILQTPKEWFKKKGLRVVLIACHAIGVASIALILFAVYRMKDGVFREMIIWVETFYATLSMYALFMVIVRYFAFGTARHLGHRKVLQVLNNSTAFFLSVVILSVVYMIPAVHNATDLKTVTYDVQINKSCNTDSLTAAVVSDFHIGGGARHSELDQMAELIDEANPDVVLIAGDICDSASSVYDLEYMESVLADLSSRYGVYYAEGNHEKDCRYDATPYLERAGVTVLKDKGVQLENGVNIIGRKNALKESTEEIMEDCGLDDDAPTIVLQHRPRGLKQLDGVADLAICGHTHGYSFPFVGVTMPLLQDVIYGQQMFGETNVIVTSGIAEWGFRTKWPSRSEVVLVNMSFKEAA